MTDFLKEGEDEIDSTRFDLLIEFAQIYPHAIKKNKNASPGIDCIWKDMKAAKHLEDEEDRMMGLKDKARRGGEGTKK